MNITEYFAKAQQGLKWPKLTYLDLKEDKFKIQFTLAGPNSKNAGCLNITDGKPYGQNRFYGVVRKDNTINWGNVDIREQELLVLIQELVNDPLDRCKATGQKFSFCCFCSTELTSKESLAVGYGPICAGKWGLPWGIVDDKIDLENL